MQRKYSLFLKDILKEIENIRSFTDELSFDDFREDEKTVYAVTRSLEIIGEATSQLPTEITSKYYKVPWQDIKDMRNIIIHHYWGVDVAIEWDIVIHELDELEKEVEHILKEELFSEKERD